MTYIKQTVHLSDGQLTKLRLAAKKKTTVTIDLNPSLPGNFELYLTQRQINKFKNGIPFRLHLSPNQLGKNGGFFFTIPAILAAIGAVSGIAGAASNIAKTVSEKKHQTAVEEEQIRHNQEVENLLKVKDQMPAATGSGAYLTKREIRSGAGKKSSKKK